MHKGLVVVMLMAFSFSMNGQKIPTEVKKLMGRYACLSCHTTKMRLVGPSFKDIAARESDPLEIAKLIKAPNIKNWPGFPAMAPMPQIKDEELKILSEFIAGLAEKEE